MSIQSIRESWREGNNNSKNFETVSRKRLESIKDIFKDKKAIIFTCGPSLKNVSQSQIKTLIDDGYVIVCVKQAIESMPNKFCHFHITNFCNEKKYSYNKTHIPIRIYCQKSESRITPRTEYDIIVSHYPNNLKDNIIVPIINGEDRMSFDEVLKRKQLKVKWGDTMYELAIPTALYVGCSHIFIVGWDCKNFKQHFYGNDSRAPRNKMRQDLDKLQVKGSSYLAKFLKKKFGVTVNLIGKGNESVFDIPYVPLKRLLSK